MNDNLLSNGELKDSYFARPITKNDDYIPYEVVEKYNKELARYKNTLEEIREIIYKREYDDIVKCYPPFTTEKQIELIKWLPTKKKGNKGNIK